MAIKNGRDRERRGQARDQHHPPHPAPISRPWVGGRFGNCGFGSCRVHLAIAPGGWKSPSPATKARSGSTGCWRRRCPDLSRSRLKALILAGRVSVINVTARPGTIRDPAYHVGPGESIILDVPEAAPAEPMAENIALRIVHEDDDIVVLDKPAGLRGAPGRRTRDRDLGERELDRSLRGKPFPASAGSSAPASCTGWTRTRLG